MIYLDQTKLDRIASKYGAEKVYSVKNQRPLVEYVTKNGAVVARWYILNQYGLVRNIYR